MIKCHALAKSFGKRDVLKGLEITFPSRGLHFVIGQSGCGKSTLLNCISGLVDFQGEITVGNTHIERLDERERCHFRLSSIGFVFQDYRLLEGETAFNNVALPIRSLSRISGRELARKVNDLLDLVGLLDRSNQMVNRMSGGEKQRVALARSLANDPKILLCDEPTGALDEKNSELLFSLLSDVSSSIPVIVVSHDVNSAERFGDSILSMDNGRISGWRALKRPRKEKRSLPVRRNAFKRKKPSLPFSFLAKHSINGMKARKWRTLLTIGITSLGLIGVGMALTVSSLVSDNIKSAYSSLLGENRIVVREEEPKVSSGLLSASFPEAVAIKDRYTRHIHDAGICYSCDFESFFMDRNEMTIASSIYRETIPGYSIRHVNEFRWLDLFNGKIYPKRPEALEEDEIVLSLDDGDISLICHSLRIVRSVTSLSEYISSNELMVCFDLENLAWQYNDQQIVRVVGFVLSREPTIYHYDHLWNEKMLEGRMRFPSSDDLAAEDKYPWVMKRISYVETIDSPSLFLSKARYDAELRGFLFDLAGPTYFPWSYADTDPAEITRLMVLINPGYGIDLSLIQYMSMVEPGMHDLIIGTTGGYAIYPEALMMGFSDTMFFSLSESALDEAVDVACSYAGETGEEAVLPPGVLSGHFSSTLADGVGFTSAFDSPIVGDKAQTLDEICISQEMAKSLQIGDEMIGKRLFLSFSYGGYFDGNGKFHREFVSTSITVCGVFDGSGKNLVGHERDWLIDFFMFRLGVSGFKLIPTSLSFACSEGTDVNQACKNLSGQFPGLTFEDPLTDIYEGIEQVGTYLQIGLFAMSGIATIISILLISFSGYVHRLETARDVETVRFIGLDRKEANGFSSVYMLLVSAFSFALASVELVVVSFVSGMEVSSMFGNGISLSLEPLAFLSMLALAGLIYLLPSFGLSKVH